MILDAFRLDGKVAVITGAGRGIGAAIATAYAEAGADVVIGSRTADQLQAVAQEVEKVGQKAAVVSGDLSTREGLSTLVDAAIATFGHIDIIVNNVGGSMPTGFMDTTERQFEEAFRWNVTTAFNLSQLALPHLLETGDGSIVNIASTAGLHSSRGFTAYGTAKSSLIKLTRHLAADLSPKIRANAICPGAIATSALEMVTSNPEIEQMMVEQTPLKRLGRPDDIAAAALYLASPAASYVTGAVLEVSGGIQGSNLEMGIPDL